MKVDYDSCEVCANHFIVSYFTQFFTQHMHPISSQFSFYLTFFVEDSFAIGEMEFLICGTFMKLDLLFV